MTKGPGCRDIERLILDREEAAFGAGDERLVRSHLRVCARCRDFEAARVGMHGELSTMVWPSLPAELDRRVLRLGRSALAGAGAKKGTASLPAPVLAALAVIIVLITLWSSVTLADVGPGQVLADLPLPAKAALLLIAQNAFMLFFTPVILRAVRPSAESSSAVDRLGPDRNIRRST